VSIKDKISWVQLGLKVLNLIELLLPSFLVAWNTHLRIKISKLEGQVAHTKYKLNVEKHKKEVVKNNANKTSQSVIDDMLGESGSSPEPKKPKAK
jgi:hypothetical protein